jgi:signal transduction histidine kinase
MRLLTKTTLFFITISLFVIFTGGILFYFSFRYIMNRQVQRELVSEMHQIIMHPHTGNDYIADSAQYYLPVHYSIKPIRSVTNPGVVFKDTMLIETLSGEYQPYCELSIETEMDGNPVRISISKSLIFSDELIKYILLVTLFLSLVLLFGIIFLNRYFVNRLWGNFLTTVDVIKDYRISESDHIELPESEIIEFQLLNEGFEKMHKRIRLDYLNLKEFIENISHEIQNPLAIIKSKIDLLQQDNRLEKSQAELVQSIQGSAIRLSNLNKSLILLSKIDNNQFQVREKVDISRSLDQIIENYEDILLTKNITLTREYKNDLIVLGDPGLISIMLLNILKNSIIHNLQSGTIDVSIQGSKLKIKNTGKKLEINQDDIFKRFIKSSSRPESLGLGLAIVKKICDYYQFGIEYSCSDIYHIITISFK